MNKKEAREKMINTYDNFNICLENVMDTYESGNVIKSAFYLGILRAAADDIFDEFEKILDQIEEEQEQKLEFYAPGVEKNT